MPAKAEIASKLNSHAVKATVDVSALKSALVLPTLSGRDRDLLQVHLVGVPTYTQQQELKELAFRMGKL